MKALYLVSHFFNCFVGFVPEFFSFSLSFINLFTGFNKFRVLVYDVPDPDNKATASFNSVFRPFKIFFGRSGKKDKKTGSVSTVFFDEPHRIDNIFL